MAKSKRIETPAQTSLSKMRELHERMAELMTPPASRPSRPVPKRRVGKRRGGVAY